MREYCGNICNHHNSIYKNNLPYNCKIYIDIACIHVLHCTLHVKQVISTSITRLVNIYIIIVD